LAAFGQPFLSETQEKGLNTMATSTDKNGAIENHESIFKGGHAAYIAHVERFMELAQEYCTSVAETVTEDFSPMASMDIALKLMITESMELFAKHNLVCFDSTTPSSIKKELIELLDEVAMPNAKNQAERIKDGGGLEEIVKAVEATIADMESTLTDTIKH
jgi:hypothetical protein